MSRPAEQIRRIDALCNSRRLPHLSTVNHVGEIDAEPGRRWSVHGVNYCMRMSAQDVTAMCDWIKRHRFPP